MERIINGDERLMVMIEGYKVTIQVTEKTLNLTDILEELLGREFEKI